MSKGLVAAPETVLNEWAAFQDPSSRVRLAIFDIDMDSLQFSIVNTSQGTDDIKEDFKLVHPLLKTDTPALIAFRGETKWILIAWIPDDAQVCAHISFLLLNC
jgi:hypothetical protein